MKKTKFRLWCKDKNEWERDSWFLGANGEIIEANSLRIMRPETHILTQYIGVKDYDGKEIYEGDICQWDCEYGIAVGIVKFKVDDEGENKFESGYTLELIEIKDRPEEEIDEPTYFKIIGNIYENPELIKKR